MIEEVEIMFSPNLAEGKEEEEEKETQQESPAQFGRWASQADGPGVQVKVADEIERREEEKSCSQIIKSSYFLIVFSGQAPKIVPSGQGGTLKVYRQKSYWASNLFGMTKISIFFCL
jgi:hypothetical protein